MELKGETKKSPSQMEIFNTPFLAINRTIRQKKKSVKTYKI